MKVLILLSLIVASSVCLAHGDKVEMVDLSVSAALEKFKAEEQSSVVNSFSGVKSWISGSTIKVRVYIEKNKDSVVYVCKIVHSGGQEAMKCN